MIQTSSAGFFFTVQSLRDYNFLMEIKTQTKDASFQ